MKELEKIILLHTQRYPEMQAVDYIKLLYQNEFGPGHLVKEPEKTLQWIRSEYESLTGNAVEKLEPIGNGLVRVHLNYLAENQLEALNEAFKESANVFKGDMDSFKEKIELLRNLAMQDKLNVTIQQLDDYLKDYEFTMVSHSEKFRKSYSPAYRVVILTKALTYGL